VILMSRRRAGDKLPSVTVCMGVDIRRMEMVFISRLRIITAAFVLLIHPTPILDVSTPTCHTQGPAPTGIRYKYFSGLKFSFP
jgi:hypothetical protein